MPTVLYSGPFRLFFYSNEGSEPVHVHIERDDKIAKYWVEPVSMSDAGGFGPSELRAIERIVIKHESAIVKKWHEYFND